MIILRNDFIEIDTKFEFKNFFVCNYLWQIWKFDFVFYIAAKFVYISNAILKLSLFPSFLNYFLVVVTQHVATVMK